jgi:hypothetical protein
MAVWYFIKQHFAFIGVIIVAILIICLLVDAMTQFKHLIYNTKAGETNHAAVQLFPMLWYVVTYTVNEDGSSETKISITVSTERP